MLTKIVEFLSAHARALDAADFDTWMASFEEDASYTVISAENLKLGLNMPLLSASNKNMIRDRILSLREANVYNIHTDHHVLGLPTVSQAGDKVQVNTPLVVHQIDQDGVATLYCIGRYLDELSVSEDAITIRKRDVVFENFGVLRLLATPI